jgi:hypothetical protein
MATKPNVSYHTFIISPQKLGNKRKDARRDASTIKRAVANANHDEGEFEDANVSNILLFIF